MFILIYSVVAGMAFGALCAMHVFVSDTRPKSIREEIMGWIPVAVIGVILVAVGLGADWLLSRWMGAS